VVVNKSTVPIGTGEFVREVIEKHQTRPVPFDVVSNPEFLREGSAIEDTLRPDRIVIGAPTQQVAMTLVELYAPLERPMIITDLPSAEVIKYASNAFLAAKISFINAIANVCETAGADVSQVMKGIGLDSRIGLAFLQPGLGYGGSCFPKDVDSLIHTAARLGYDFKLLRSVVEINRERPPTDRRDEEGARPPRGQDGGRARPRLQAEHRRHARGQEPRGHPDAPCRRRPRAGLRSGGDGQCAGAGARERDVQRLRLCGGRGRGCGGPHHGVERFKYLNLERLRGLLRRPLIFDGRNLWEPERMRRLGFEYYSIGRKPVLPA
jgi:UDPglucose 6-dehydrogenase